MKKMNFRRGTNAQAQWVNVDVRITACRDSKDDKFLEVAVTGHATHIVTGDEDLLALNPFLGIQIVSPQVLLKP